MKKIISLTGCLLLSTIFLFAAPGKSLLSTFNNAFPNAENVKWYEDDKGYLVSFSQAETRVKVWYDKDEDFISCLRYYDEKELPFNILMAIKKKYPNKSIFGVTERSSTEDIVYFIKMEDDKNWYTIKSTVNGKLQLVEHLKKQVEKE